MSELTRRSFLQVIGAGSAAFVLGCTFDTKTGSKPTETEPLGPGFVANAFVEIESNGTVRITASKSDMGQGVRTAFAVLIAEELDADWSKVVVVQAQADSKKYGGQGVGGSQTIMSMNQRLREFGGSARMMLVAAAAKTWGVDPSTCRTENGKVFHDATKKSLDYGKLAEVASTMPVPTGEVKLKSPSEFKLIGKRNKRVDNKDVVTGKAKYGLDISVEGMVFAAISRRPSLGASVKSFDDKATRKVEGVLDVIQMSSGVAVIGKNTWAALKGRKALVVEWEEPNKSANTKAIRAGLLEAVGDHKEMPAGSKVVNATYDFPFLAHATMEPMNAVADVRDDSATIWTPTQQADGAQNQVMRALNLPADKVVVNVTLIGGGFGRRLSNDYVAEAVQISKQIKKPVKLIWSRDDDMKNDNYRPMSHHALRGAVKDGKALAWSHQFIKAGRGARKASNFGNADIAYAIDDAGMAQGAGQSPVPTGAWRSVDHSQSTVANEVFMNELAIAAGVDPVAFRKSHLRNQRLIKVLELAVEKSNWSKPLPAGWGRGVACFQGYGSFAAHVVEVSVKDKKIKVERVICAVDCGQAINVSGVEAQMQGACIDGISTALKSEITVTNGQIDQTSYTDFEWCTMAEAPKIEVHLIQGGDRPGGMGEVGYPGVPAAVANAVHNATGQPVRAFPIRLS